MKTKLKGMDLARLVGKTTRLKIEWQSWDKLPPAYQQVYVILRLEKGYFAVTGELLEPQTWKRFKFDNPILPDIYIGGKDKNVKRLKAWGLLQRAETNDTKDS